MQCLYKRYKLQYCQAVLSSGLVWWRI